MDSSGVDIRATFFQDAVDKFYEILEPTKSYTFCDGIVKAANAQYNTCKSSFEITFDANADIQPCKDQQKIQVQYDFCAGIATLENAPTPATVDVAAMVLEVEEVSSFVPEGKENETHKRSIVLIDDSGCKIAWTLWGANATADPPETGNLILIRHTRLTEYHGRTLSGASQWETVYEEQLSSSSPDDAPAKRVQELWQWKQQQREALETAIVNARSLTIAETTTSVTTAHEENDVANTVTPAATKRKVADVSPDDDDLSKANKQLKKEDTTDENAIIQSQVASG
jgi:hypothetical protein